MKILLRTLTSTAALLASACAAVGPDYAPPEAAVPASWRAEAEAGERLEPGSAELGAWWRRLGDPLLGSLVERATRDSHDVRGALARVREARALRGIAASERYPTVDATLGYERRLESENTAFGEFIEDSDLFSAGFDASWEIDLWGRVRRGVEAADAGLEATVEDARDVLVTVAAEVAFQYVELRAFQRRLAIARTNVALQEETRELVRQRFESGLVGGVDLAQARSNLEATRSRVPALEIGLRGAENRLAVLLGLAPGALAAELGPEGAIPVPPASVAVGVPADLLRRRPDVRRAERLLAAETARVGLAEAELYPRLALSGNLGVAAEEVPELFGGDSATLGIGPSLRWNLFDAGRLRERVAAQEARTEGALLRWELAVLRALEESENAMTAFVREEVRRSSLLEAVAQSRLAVGYARTQYGEGLSDFQAVLDSERALAQLEDELARSDAAITTSLIALYKALGGGFGGDPRVREAAGGDRMGA